MENTDRYKLVSKAVETWRKQLVDLTGQNRLIYYRHLKAGTLELKDVDETRLSSLLGGAKVKVSELMRHPSPTATKDDHEELLKYAVKRARSIQATGLTNFEERGISTLFIANSLATWDAASTSTAKPNAPVLLAAATLTPTGSSKDDFAIERVGPWEINQTLLIFLSEVFGLDIDESEVEALVQSNEDDPRAIVNGLEKIVKAAGVIKEFEVVPSILIGNFSYTKLPMVKDLERNVGALARNALIAAIADDKSAQEEIRNENSLDGVREDIPDTIDLSDEFLILDADSSQSHVINAVLSGRSLVIEGPPGTGKSQTIANLIAGLAAQGKTALFVAEKRAAIEAVLKRLEAVGLGSLALDLHSSTIKRKDTAQSLAHSLESLTSVATPDVKSGQTKLSATRKRLIDYQRELHTKRAPWDLSSFEVNSELLAYDPAASFITLDSRFVATLDSTTQARHAEVLGRWTSTRLSIDWASPWIDSPISSSSDATELIGVVNELRTRTIPALEKAVDGLGIDLSCSLDDRSLASLATVVGLIQDAANFEQIFEPSIWQEDVGSIADLMQSKSRIGFGSKQYRAAKKTLKEVSKSRLKRSDLISKLHAAEGLVERWQELGLPSHPTDSVLVGDVILLLAEVEVLLSKIRPGIFKEAKDHTPAEVSAELDRLDSGSREAILLGQMNDDRSVLVSAGLQELVESVEQGRTREADVQRVWELSCLQGIRRAIDDHNPVLNTFIPNAHGDVAAEYEAGDRWHRDSAAQRVLRAVAEHALAARNAYPGQSDLIAREAKKKSRHKSLRQLQREAGAVLTALRPCWMMSPLMVAQALPPVEAFDYVIFDEASQIRPEEAISAILRGANIAVAGDRRQLPPSAFFSSANSDGEGEYDEDEDDSLTVGYESILDVTSSLLPSRTLSWHYRSKDERLIKLSNDHIYERMLTTFPGAARDTPVTFHKVDYIPADASEVRSNPKEVAAVVDLMVEHARLRPDETLGVIAFGQHHASSISDALRERLREEASDQLDEFFDEDLPERVFVKNIERVQGDERDAIILTIGYGKNPNGVVPHRFGPVNQEGGERRINVAASRARARMTVVSSITAADLETSSLGKGPQLLEALLRFAATGGTESGADPAAVPLNPFELAVKGELERLGLEPICQYGQSNYRIDFVLPHPANDGRMVLAVEADGASYHSSPTARDRDRLRQEALERLGWQFYRIWSTAFFKDPVGEATKVREAFDAVVAGESLRDAKPKGFQPPVGKTATKSSKPKPYFKKGVPIAQHDHLKLVALASWIADGGNGLLTDEEIKERMKQELGYSRRGARIEQAMDSSIASMRRKG